MTEQAGIRSLNVVDLTGNLGGGTRFVRALLPALQRARPSLRITFMGTPASVGKHAQTDLTNAGIVVRALRTYQGMAWTSQDLRTRLRFRLRRYLKLEPSRAEYLAREFAREIDGADAVYFPWPYNFPVPQLASPMVATIHDLNFRYFFGTPIFKPTQVPAMDAQIREWIRAGRVIASSRFMASEIERFYPEAGAVPVSGLAPFSGLEDGDEAPGPLPAGVRRPYVLAATNTTVHKNLGALFATQAILRDRFPDLQLVLAGTGTDRTTGRATEVGSTSPLGEADVIGLGYVSDREVADLIDAAEVLVNVSLYEAGNGSGLDAWSRGTPVAMSDIAPFTEHLTALGVEAALFRPRDPIDIAAKIGAILDDPAAAKAAAERSKAAISRHTWDDVAVRYLALFDDAFGRRVHA